MEKASSMIDPHRIELIDEDGKVRLVEQGSDGWTEPLCIECDQPIRWVLDMMSFKHCDDGTFKAGHARCLWTKDGFTAQRKLAQP